MREAPNLILEFLTARAKPTGDACRSNPRRRSSARVEVAWLEEKEWRTIPGRLHDISRGGAALITRSCPITKRPIRLRISEGEGSPWVEAEILGVESDGERRHRIRIKFIESCPNFMLRLAVLNSIDASEPREAPPAWVEWTPTC